jgi:iron complex transport system ATP-binding protein
VLPQTQTRQVSKIPKHHSSRFFFLKIHPYPVIPSTVDNSLSVDSPLQFDARNMPQVDVRESPQHPFTLTNDMTTEPRQHFQPETSSAQLRASASEVKPANQFLHMRRVNVALGDRVVLHDIDLTIQTGEHVAILGANGCGKSTLIRTMTCELYPLIPGPGHPSPEVSIFGRSRWELTQLRQHFGVVSDTHPGLYSTSRAPDTAGSAAGRTSGLDAVIAGFFSASTLWPNLIVTEEMRLRAAEAMERIHASHLAAHTVGEMSAGEKRRILIARALVHRPSQLLLDEPSNALDLAAQRDLRESLRNLMHQGTGLILVTHHLNDIPPEIERVILMSQGRIVADGPREQLLTAPVLSDLFQTQVRIGQHDGWLHSW